jgi:hypothetical protein
MHCKQRSAVARFVGHDHMAADRISNSVKQFRAIHRLAPRLWLIERNGVALFAIARI